MTSNEDLNKLFEAALGQKKAPSRFGTPEEQQKCSPVPRQTYQRPAQVSPSPFAGPPQQPTPAASFQAMPAGNQAPPAAFSPASAAPYHEVSAPQVGFTAAPAQGQMVELEVQRNSQGEASLDCGLNKDLSSILDMKIARAKKRRRRSFVLTLLIFVGVTGGTSAWFVSSPERYNALQKTIADIKSVGDIKGMVAEYQKSLDKIAVRGEQINEATSSMGIDPASAEGVEDQGFNTEMQAMMGEDGGPTTASRNAKLAKKFESVRKNGTLMPGAR